MEIEEGRQIDASVKTECLLVISDKGSFSSFLISGAYNVPMLSLLDRGFKRNGSSLPRIRFVGTNHLQ